MRTCFHCLPEDELSCLKQLPIMNCLVESSCRIILLMEERWVQLRALAPDLNLIFDRKRTAAAVPLPLEKLVAYFVLRQMYKSQEYKEPKPT